MKGTSCSPETIRFEIRDNQVQGSLARVPSDQSRVEASQGSGSAPVVGIVAADGSVNAQWESYRSRARSSATRSSCAGERPVDRVSRSALTSFPMRPRDRPLRQATRWTRAPNPRSRSRRRAATSPSQMRRSGRKTRSRRQGLARSGWTKCARLALSRSRPKGRDGIKQHACCAGENGGASVARSGARRLGMTRTSG